MHPGNAEPLARWADSLQATLGEVEAQRSRPLPSPGLRCLSALVQAVRLARVVRDGARVLSIGSAQARLIARTTTRWNAMRLCGPVALRTGYTVGCASSGLLRASVQVGWEGWSTWAAARALPRLSATQRLIRTVTLGRAALMALGEVCHDRG